MSLSEETSHTKYIQEITNVQGFIDLTIEELSDTITSGDALEVSDLDSIKKDLEIASIACSQSFGLIRVVIQEELEKNTQLQRMIEMLSNRIKFLENSEPESPKDSPPRNSPRSMR